LIEDDDGGTPKTSQILNLRDIADFNSVLLKFISNMQHSSKSGSPGCVPTCLSNRCGKIWTMTPPAC